jgi:glyoxylase-like metal-dependent hydrolase (beta-lactamase superfamily II)
MTTPSWTRIPGTRATDLLARVGKPSILCSNTYLLRSPEALAVIDPGADERAAAHLRALLLEERRAHPRPVYVLLTHCHYDHTGALPVFLDPELGATLVCHGLGLTALMRGDTRLPMPTFFGREPVPVPGGVPLFAPGPGPGHGARDPGGDHAASRAADGRNASRPAAPGLAEESDGPDGPRAVLSLGGGDALSIRPTPGHTPDGLTFCLGQFVFPGDIPFAANPGVAGVQGWDAAALGESLALLGGLCRQGRTLLSGHGDALEPGMAARVLESQARKAQGLTDIVRLDEARCAVLDGHTGTLLNEMERILSILGGRLLKVSHTLEVLEEPEAAARVLSLLDTEGAEAMLASLRQCRTQARDSAVQQDKLFIQATQTVSRLGRMLRSEELAALAGRSLARRGQRLLADYLNEVLGLCYDAPGPSVDLAEAVSGLVDRLAGPAADPAGLLEASGDHASFVRELTSVLADNRLFARTRLRFAAPDRPLRAAVDRHGLEDLLAAVLEQAAVAQSREVELSARAEGSRIRLTIQAEPGRDLRIQAALGDYLRLALSRVNGDLAVDPDAPQRCDILLPAAPGPGANL